ncbi:MAG: ABC transporter ATP-binding protein [Acidimicrobiia bacterium]
MLFRLLRSHLRKYRRELTLVLVFQFCQTIATLTLPSLNADIIDKGVVKGDTGYIWSVGSVMLVVAFVQVVFAIAAVYYGSRAAMGFGRDVRGSLFHTVTDYSAREVAHFGAPSLITRITNDVQQVQMLVQMSCTLLIAAPMMIVGGVIMAMREDLSLSTILLVSVPVMVVTVGGVVWRMVPQFQQMQERIDRVNQVLREQIAGIRVVRAFVREPDEARRFATDNGRLTDTSLRAGHLMAFIFPTVLLVINLSSTAAVWMGGNRISAGQMQPGALIAFLSYLIQILISLMMATFMVMLVPRAAVCADRIQEVLETPSTVTQAESPVRELPEHGLLELRDVGFHYPGAEEPVLSGISLTVRAGETTAIIGSTGSGKTTLLDLVPRLFDVTSGSVLVDGIDVRDVDLQVLWSRVGLVPQRPYLFSGTVASNLRYGDPAATDGQLWQALDIAQASDFVRAMPGGLEARIEQGGTNVSGGQRQRLAIARALVRRPDIYLFDDSFSALDLATDARLRAALVPYTREAAIVVVAQRVSTILHADQILVLEDGRPVGLGTHHELLERCPTYAEIVASQMTAEEAA